MKKELKMRNEEELRGTYKQIFARPSRSEKKMQNQRRNGEEQSRFKSKEVSTGEKKGKCWKKKSNQTEEKYRRMKKEEKLSLNEKDGRQMEEKGNNR
jgi:hypothetical protein